MGSAQLRSRMNSRRDGVVGRLAQIYELESGSSRSHAMEGLRGFAVLLVFFVHCFGLILARRVNTDVDALSINSLNGWNAVLKWLFMSHHGVYLFFILSGFLICRLMQKADFSYPKFIWKRVLRIYPAFLFSLLVCILVGIYSINDFVFDLPTFIKNLFFLNGVTILKVTPYNRVTWSLFNEFSFYLTVPLIYVLVGPRLLRERWMIVALGYVLVYGPYLIGYVDARYSFFFVGMFVASFKDADLRRFCDRLPTPFVIGCYLFATTAWVFRVVDFGTFVLFFCAGGALLFIKSSYGEGTLNRLFSYRPLRYLGNISYSFYLIHALVIDALFNKLFGDGGVLFEPLWIAIFIVVSFAGGWLSATLMFVVLERPYFPRKDRATFANSAP